MRWRLPELAFAGQKAVAQHAAQCTVILRFLKIGVLSHQNGLDILGPVDKAHWNAQKAQVDDVTVIAHATSEIADRVPARLEYIAKYRKSLWSRRQFSAQDLFASEAPGFGQVVKGTPFSSHLISAD